MLCTQMGYPAARQLSPNIIWSFTRCRTSESTCNRRMFLRGPRHCMANDRNPPDVPSCSSVLGMCQAVRGCCLGDAEPWHDVQTHRFASLLSCSGSNARRHPGDSSDDDATHKQSRASDSDLRAQGEEEDDEAHKRWNQAELYAADLRRASTPSPPKMRANYSTRYFKILVVRLKEHLWDAGLCHESSTCLLLVQGLSPRRGLLLQAGAPASGKTTFIQNLASSYGHEDAPETPVVHQSPLLHSSNASEFVESFSTDPTTLEDFKDAPDSLCTRVLFTDETAKTNYRLLIQAGPVRMHLQPDPMSATCVLYQGVITMKVRWELERPSAGEMPVCSLHGPTVKLGGCAHAGHPRLL